MTTTTETKLRPIVENLAAFKKQLGTLPKRIEFVSTGKKNGYNLYYETLAYGPFTCANYQSLGDALDSALFKLGYTKSGKNTYVQ